MRPSNLYIPDPQKWIHFFKNKTQVGKGVSLPGKTVSNACHVSVKAVSPAEQTVNQAKSELKREDINMLDSGILSHNKNKRRRRRTAKSSKRNKKRSSVKHKKIQKPKRKKRNQRRISKAKRKRNKSVVKQKKKKRRLNATIRQTDIFDN